MAPIHDAAKAGDVDKLQRELAAGIFTAANANVNKKDVRLAPPSSLARSPCSSSPARLPPPAARKRGMRQERRIHSPSHPQQTTDPIAHPGVARARVSS